MELSVELGIDFVFVALGDDSRSARSRQGKQCVLLSLLVRVRLLYPFHQSLGRVRVLPSSCAIRIFDEKSLAGLIPFHNAISVARAQVKHFASEVHRQAKSDTDFELEALAVRNFCPSSFLLLRRRTWFIRCTDTLYGCVHFDTIRSRELAQIDGRLDVLILHLVRRAVLTRSVYLLYSHNKFSIYSSH